MFVPFLIAFMFLFVQPVLADALHYHDNNPCGRNEHDTFGEDKIMHAEVSMSLGIISGTMIENKYTAFGVAMIPGILKEISDSQQKHNFFSKGDIIADAVGAALGVWFGNTYIRPTVDGIIVSGKF